LQGGERECEREPRGERGRRPAKLEEERERRKQRLKGDNTKL